MKTTLYLFLPLLFFIFSSCEKEEVDPEQESGVLVNMSGTLSVEEPQEILVKITTPTPCYSIEVKKTSSGNTFDYDFILLRENITCIQVVKEHTLTVLFDPPAPGEYTLNFLKDGNLQETRTVVVNE